MALIIEVLIPAMAFGLVAWWLWLRSRGRPTALAQLRAELDELRAFQADAERRLQTLETIATLDERRVRVAREQEAVDESGARAEELKR